MADFDFDGTLVEWRGPSPYVFVEIPTDDSELIKEAARGLEYWGQVAVRATIGAVDFETALFPKDGRYLLPLRVAVRRQLGLEIGDTAHVQMDIRHGRTGP